MNANVYNPLPPQKKKTKQKKKQKATTKQTNKQIRTNK